MDVNKICKKLLACKNHPVGKSADLAAEELYFLCDTAKEIFLQQPNLLELEAPVKIVGDIHGQFSDLLQLFEYGGLPPSSNYLFLGDYIDRGLQGIECVALMLCFKIKYPLQFFMLRGNHECASINRIYGFYDECKSRYTIKLWRQVNELFNCLPVAAIISKKIFCIHGGLSPELVDIAQILEMERPTDVPDSGLLCDFLWSDPDPYVVGWTESDRGVSYVFGSDVVQEFLRTHDFDLVVRAHQVVEDGYEFFGENREMVTLFSAANYCGEFDNAAALMLIDADLTCSFKILTSNKQRWKILKTNHTKEPPEG